MKNLLFLVFIAIVWTGCTDQQTELQKLNDEVIRIHDDVMPKVADINRVKRKLKVIENDSTLNETQVLDIRNQILFLTKAEEGMSKWMAEYKAPGKEMDFEAAMEHLNNEKTKISEVRDEMLSSLKTGTALLKKMED